MSDVRCLLLRRTVRQLLIAGLRSKNICAGSAGGLMPLRRPFMLCPACARICTYTLVSAGGRWGLGLASFFLFLFYILQ
jgi:hypothetical protein